MRAGQRGQLPSVRWRATIAQIPQTGQSTSSGAAAAAGPAMHPQRPVYGRPVAKPTVRVVGPTTVVVGAKFALTIEVTT